jgi:hypothetical protein
MRPIHVWRSRTPDGDRYEHFPSVIITIPRSRTYFFTWLLRHRQDFRLRSAQRLKKCLNNFLPATATNADFGALCRL